MRRKMQKITIPKSVKSDNRKKENLENSSKTAEKTPVETYLEILNKRFPHKLNYSIEETAKTLSQSYDFVRERVIDGTIPALRYGKNYKITRYELAKILSQGVE